MKKALIVVDVQNDFCEGGALPVHGGASVAEAIAGRLRHPSARAWDYVVATQDMHENPGAHFSDEPNFATTWPRHCVAGTKGADLRPELDGVEWDGVFHKGRFSAAYSGFEGEEQRSREHLADWLRSRDVTDVDIVGIATDHCVVATAVDALIEKFRVRILSDYCAAVSPFTGEQALRDLRAAGAVVV